MKKPYYIRTLEGMFDENITKGTYDQIADVTKENFYTFRSLLYWNCKNIHSYDIMRPKSNQPAMLYTQLTTD